MDALWAIALFGTIATAYEENNGTPKELREKFALSQINVDDFDLNPAIYRLKNFDIVNISLWTQVKFDDGNYPQQIFLNFTRKDGEQVHAEFKKNGNLFSAIHYKEIYMVNELQNKFMKSSLNSRKNCFYKRHFANVATTTKGNALSICFGHCKGPCRQYSHMPLVLGVSGVLSWGNETLGIEPIYKHLLRIPSSSQILKKLYVVYR